jgi:hypothetical protein
MAIKYQKTFDQFTPPGFDGVFDWDFLKPAFNGTKIEPMDIDALVERRGKFLIFETKTPDRKTPQGQLIALEQLLKLGRGNIHLFFVWGKTAETIVAMEEWSYRNGTIVKSDRIDCDGAHVLKRVSAWFKYANTF